MVVISKHSGGVQAHTSQSARCVGHPAELAVAKAYSEGVGVKTDADEGAKWLRRAAEGGSKEAAAELERTNPH